MFAGTPGATGLCHLHPGSTMVPPADDDEAQERANELYWASEGSVNSIAEELGLSKGSLYQLVRPLPAGLPCPRCGSEMEYPNRTARDRGFLACPSCDLEEDEDVVKEAWHEDGEPDGVVVRPSLGEGAGRRIRAMGAGNDRTRIVLAATFLGAAAGLVVALWSRKK